MSFLTPNKECVIFNIQEVSKIRWKLVTKQLCFDHSPVVFPSPLANLVQEVREQLYTGPVLLSAEITPTSPWNANAAPKRMAPNFEPSILDKSVPLVVLKTKKLPWLVETCGIPIKALSRSQLTNHDKWGD